MHVRAARLAFAAPFSAQSHATIWLPRVPRALQIWEEQSDGSYTLVHSAYVCPEGGGCEPGSSAWHSPFEALESVRRQSVPAYSSRHVRLTFGHGRLFPDCNEHMDYMHSAGDGWGSALKLAYIQCGAWYANFYDFAPPEQFEPDLRSFLANQRSACEVCCHHHHCRRLVTLTPRARHHGPQAMHGPSTS